MEFTTLEIDIEKCPCEAWVWDGGKQYVTAEQIIEPGRIICIAYKWEGSSKVEHLQWDAKQNDKKMLKDFIKVAQKADCIVGHNGKKFDVREINSRIAYHGLAPLPVVALEDTLIQCKAKFRLPSFKLSYLVEYFKVGHKLSTTGGLKLWMRVWKNNDQEALAEMVRYCKNDVKVLAALRERIRPYVKPTRDMRKWSKDPASCSTCGSTNTIKYGVRRNTAGVQLQRIQCKECYVTSSFPVPKERKRGR